MTEPKRIVRSFKVKKKVCHLVDTKVRREVI